MYTGFGGYIYLDRVLQTTTLMCSDAAGTNLLRQAQNIFKTRQMYSNLFHYFIIKKGPN